MGKQIIYETIYDLSYLAGVDKLSETYDIDSREIYGIILDWAEEFENKFKDVDWDTTNIDYLTEISNFYDEKVYQLEEEENAEKYREMQLDIISKLENLVHKRFNETTLNLELTKIFGEEIKVEIGCEDVDYLADWDYMFISNKDIIGGDFDIYFLKHRENSTNRETFMVTEVSYEFNNRYY